MIQKNMKLYLSKLPWHKNNNVWVTGFILSGNRHLRGNDLLNYFSEIFTTREFELKLVSANGQFSVVIQREGEIWAATDRLRNWPLFYTQIKGEFIISDDCYRLAEMQEENQFDADSVSCFLGSGYVINNRTLLRNIFQVEAGSYLILGKEARQIIYHDIKHEQISDTDLNSGSIKLNNLLIETFRDHLNALNDKFIAIPLSGGYDSRLVAAMAARYHPENILCYTYGIKNNPEVAPAKEAAARLGIKWINIIYDKELIKDFLHDKFFNEYYPYVSDLSGMFFLQEYFAVKFLKENYFIPENTVFISGYSGDMIAGSYLIPGMSKKSDKNEISQLIFREYFKLVRFGKTRKNDLIRLIEDRISDDKSETWRIIETWDIKERHAKFIVNSAKVFSFFGFDYVFPLWDNRLVDYLMNVPFSLRLNRKLYEHTLKEHVFRNYSLNLKNEINPSPLKKSFQRFKENIKTVIPDQIRNQFLNPLSPVFYDKITEQMLEEIDSDKIISPAQPNYYNSFITQWYLQKTADRFNIEMIR